MATRIVTADGVYDLSNITNHKELKEEISFLRESLNRDEKELEERFRQLPHRMVRSAADNFLPSFLNKLIANGTWKLLLGSVAMFANPFSKGFSFKKNILGSAKKLGLIALLKSAYSFWSNRKTSKQGPVIHSQKLPAVTTLKTRHPAK